jgi:co-chaperonin GroES (HSP10)
MKLLHDNVLIQPDKAPETSPSGIILTSNALKELPPFGRVMAVGSKITDIKVDDRVIYSAYAGMEVGEDTVIVPYAAVMGVVDAN